MRTVLISIVTMLGLIGCATPVTILKNPTTGQVVRCGGGVGGSIAFGLAGYSIERHNDAHCVKDYQAGGFIPTEINGIAVNQNIQDEPPSTP